MRFSQRFVSIVCLLDGDVSKEKHIFQRFCGIAPVANRGSSYQKIVIKKVK